MLSSFRQDLAFGFRTLRRSPAFAIVAILSLSLGIGANTAVFSVLDAVVFRDLPVKDPQSLVLIRRSAGPARQYSLSYLLLGAIAGRRDVLAQVCGSGQIPITQASLESGGSLGRLSGRLATGNYFAVLGIRAAAGRFFSPGEAQPAAVIGYGFWERQWARSPAAIGARLTLNRVPVTVIGVAPRGFFGDSVGGAPDVYLPVELQPQMMPGLDWLANPRTHWLTVLGRLQPGFSRDSAEAALDSTFREASERAGRRRADTGRERLVVLGGAKGLRTLEDRFAQPLYILMALVGLLLLIACGNLANLLLARASARQKEISLRVALGAGRGRLLRQVLTECLLLSAGGGLAALWLAVFGRDALVAMVSDPASPISLDRGFDWRIFAFTLGFALLTTFLFGLVPALKTSQTRVSESLKSTSAGAGIGRERRLAGQVLAGLQVALCVILLAGAGLMLRTLANLRAVDDGFRHENVLLVEFAWDASADGFRRLTRLPGLLGERLRGAAGLGAFGFSSYGGLSESVQTTAVSLPSGPVETGLEVRMNSVSPGYFDAYGIQLLRGRSFRDSDTPASGRVVVINQSAAKRIFPGEDPVGKRVGLGNRYDSAAAFEVIGVVRDAKWRSLREEMFPIIYTAQSQSGSPVLFLALRTTAEARAMAGQIRAAVSEADPRITVGNVGTLVDQIEGTMRTERLLARLSSVFAVLALILAATGIYGTTSYGVSRRTREIGIRMALGADPAGVRGMVVREAAIVAAAGIVVAAPVAVICGSLARSALFGVHAADPVALGGAVLVLLSAALLSAWLPGRRASRLDPVTALRWE